VTGNRPLRDYYESAGFVHRGDLAGEFVRRDGSPFAWQTSLYERSTNRATP
jgi:hypothetical protein